MFDVQSVLNTLSSRPGVYQMLNVKGQIIYIGKACNLKRRVSSYFQSGRKDQKTLALLKHVSAIQTIITANENEALLLEHNLIKKHSPHYNILFRDDKSYPYIVLSKDEFPRLALFRGKRKKDERYFGPYPNTTAVRDTIRLLQKIFRIRSCKNSFFSSRARSCLQFQIKRCSAPCVNLISQEEYAQSVQYVLLFLEGKSDLIIDHLIQSMKNASSLKQYELAARCRDQVSQLREIQSQQIISTAKGESDVVVISQEEDCACVHVLKIRSGRVLGSQNYFSSLKGSEETSEILSFFLSQYYLRYTDEIPEEILLNCKIDQVDLLQSVLTEQSGHSVQIKYNVRGRKAKWIQMSRLNAEHALQSYLMKKKKHYSQLVALQQFFSLDQLPRKIECFDVSHTMGEAAVASCVVFDRGGPNKKAYRSFNIEKITPGDDCAAMHQALARRYQRAKKERSLPDIILIDGGKGQLKEARKVLHALNIDGVMLIGIAKGVARRPGEEVFYVSNSNVPICLTRDSLIFRLLQHIRDEAHRFALQNHRKKRGKARTTSILENIPGVAQSRRTLLLQHFGGLQGMKKASIDDLCKVPHISRKLAERIYNFLHEVISS